MSDRTEPTSADVPAAPGVPAAPDVPAAVRDLADARSDARRERDWARADALKAEIEAAGWRVIDAGYASRLVPARAPDVVTDGRVRYGESASVPDRFAEGAAVLPLTVAIRLDAADPSGEEGVAVLRRLAAGLPAGAELVAVVDGTDVGDTPEDARGRVATEVAGLEIVEMARRVGVGGCINAANRYARGEVVVWVGEPSRIADGGTAQVAAALARALEDADVAIAGAEGLRSGDLRRWESAPAGPVDAVTLTAAGWRRDDALQRGPLDERFLIDRHLAVWWSLVLRDEDEEDRAPRGAVAVEVRLEGSADETQPERDRIERRDFYRIVDRFGHRYDLLQAPAPRRRRPSG